MFAYCNNNPVMHRDPNGESGLFLAFLIDTAIGGISNAISTAIDGGSVEECVVSGFIGAASSAIGFGVGMLTGFSPLGSIAARATSSALCDIGTNWYRNGEITANDIGYTAIDVTFDVCFSTLTYYYTDSINNFTRQTLVNSIFDAGVDVVEGTTYSGVLSSKAKGIIVSGGVNTGGTLKIDGSLRNGLVQLSIS